MKFVFCLSAFYWCQNFFSICFCHFQPLGKLISILWLCFHRDLCSLFVNVSFVCRIYCDRSHLRICSLCINQIRMFYFFEICSQFHIFLNLEYIRILLADNLLGFFLCEAYKFIILGCRHCTHLDLSSCLIRILLRLYCNASHLLIICYNRECKFLYWNLFKVCSQICIFCHLKYIWIGLTDHVSFCIGPVYKTESFVCYCDYFCFFPFFVASVC